MKNGWNGQIENSVLHKPTLCIMYMEIQWLLEGVHSLLVRDSRRGVPEVQTRAKAVQSKAAAVRSSDYFSSSAGSTTVSMPRPNASNSVRNYNAVAPKRSPQDTSISCSNDHGRERRSFGGERVVRRRRVGGGEAAQCPASSVR